MSSKNAKRILTRQLKVGEVLDDIVVDRLGRCLIKPGTVVTDYIINSLLERGITMVFISTGEEEETSDNVEISKKAKVQIEKLRTPDPKKVSLKEEVKKRVSDGIQLIYSLPDDNDQVCDTANHIVTDLFTAIDENDAVALDISELKISDEYTFKHSVDVATISMIIAKNLNYSDKQLREIGMAGLLHDVGKAKIPLEILNKPAALTKGEFAIMKQHSILGYNTIKNIPGMEPAVALGVLEHHEKMNGMGYPDGKDFSQISQYAKILNVADIYDALVTTRPYKSAKSQRESVEMIMAMAVSELDSAAVNSFMQTAILYPVDSIVTLSNGETAQVVKKNPNLLLRPTVVGIESGIVYDLSDLKNASIVIL